MNVKSDAEKRFDDHVTKMRHQQKLEKLQAQGSGVTIVHATIDGVIVPHTFIGHVTEAEIAKGVCTTIELQKKLRGENVS